MRHHRFTVLAFLLMTLVLTLYLHKNTMLPITGKKHTDNDVTIKEIVAYSMLKTIEMEEHFLQCPFTDPQRLPRHPQHPLGRSAWTKVPGTDFQIYSAYLDQRLDPFVYVRILGMSKGQLNGRLLCTTFTTKRSVTSLAIIKKIWAENWIDPKEETNFNVFLVSCRILDTDFEALSISRNACDSQSTFLNAEKVSKENLTENFVICVKPLNFQEDIVWSLMHWLELNRILGASKVQIYINKAQNLTLHLLDFYRNYTKSLVLPIKHYPLGNSKDIWQKRKDEVLTYNDCLYRNLQAKFILPLDIDEVLLPKKDQTWHQLVQRFPEGYASYSVRHAYFFHKEKDFKNYENIKSNENNKIIQIEEEKEKEENEKEQSEKPDKEPIFFRNFQRSQFAGAEENCKSFVAVENALTVFNHYALQVVRPGLRSNYNVPTVQAQLNHYRRNCSVDLLPQCALYYSSRKIVDTLLADKYKKRFFGAFNQARNGFLYWLQFVR